MFNRLSFHPYNKYKFLRNFNLILILLFQLLNSSSVYCQPIDVEENLFSHKNRLVFGNYLFKEKDYLRAINEFKNYLMNYDNDTVRFKFAECFLRIGRYTEAADNFKGLFFNSSLSEEARFSYYKSLFFNSDFYLFRDQTRMEGYFTEKYSKEIDRLYYTSHLMDESILPDFNNFIRAFADSNKNSIRNFYYMKKYPDRKSPTTAMLLSLFLPGAGKIYTGQVGDGITAFLTTGVLTYLAASNFKHDHNFRGWLFAGLAAFSYAGTVYGSYASAQIYNAGVKFSFDNEVKLYFEKRNYLLPEFNFLKN